MIQVETEIHKLEPSAIIELFVLDASNSGAGIFYFHAGTNNVGGNIVWQGQTYVKFPIEFSGFEISGQGQLPRPKLKTANILGSISTMLISFNDLVGAKITRKRTFKKYLDEINFSGGNPSADPTAHFLDDIFFIDRKSSENKIFVEFELCSTMDLAGVQLPKRQIIQNVCPWIYRSSECSYAGTNYFDSNDKSVTSSSQDVCGKKISSCKARFGATAELPIGSFPSAGLIRE